MQANSCKSYTFHFPVACPTRTFPCSDLRLHQVHLYSGGILHVSPFEAFVSAAATCVAHWQM